MTVRVDCRKEQFITIPANLTSLGYARYVGAGGNCGASSGWQCETVNLNTQVNTTFQHPSLALNANDQPRIAYSSFDYFEPPLFSAHVLRFAEHHPNPSPMPSNCNPASDYWGCSNITFRASNVDHSDAVIVSALAVGLEGTEETDHIAAYIPGELIYVRNNNGSNTDTSCANDHTWKCAKIDDMRGTAVNGLEPYGMPVSLSLDADGNPIIAYQLFKVYLPMMIR